MDSSWISVVPAVSVAFCLLVLPGFLVLLAARVQFRTTVGLSGVVSASVLAVSAIVAPYLGLDWNMLTVLIGTLIAVLLTILVRALFDKFEHRSRDEAEPSGAYVTREGGRPRRTAAMELIGMAAAALGACLIGWRLIQIFQMPGYISQTADNIFHLNVVRYMQETDSASALTAGGVQGTGPAFYPAVWHGVTALVSDVTGTGIPESANSVNIIIGAILWPLGAVFAARVLFGNRPLIMFSAAVASSAFSAYPYLLVDWGVVYPNFYAMALVLPAIALAVLVLRAATKRPTGVGILLWLVLLACPGLALTHPNALLVLIVALLPLVLSSYVGWAVTVFGRPVASGSLRFWCVLTGMAGLAVLSAAWVALRPLPVGDFANTWQPYQTTAQAVGEVLFTTHAARDAAYATAALVLVGAVALVCEKTVRWYLAGYLLTALLFVFASGVENSPLRTFLTGGWYDDQNRLAAATAVLAVPLAAKGATVLADLLGLLSRRTRIPLRVATAVSAAVILTGLLLVSQETTVRPAVQEAAKRYSLGLDSDIMSTNELELFEEIDDIVPETATVAGNPWDGSAWVYMVSGRTALFPHVQTPMTPQRALIAESLRDAATNPEVCAALEELNVEYAVNSGELIYLPGNPANEKYPGVGGLDGMPGFEKVGQVGSAELFRITACD